MAFILCLPRRQTLGGAAHVASFLAFALAAGARPAVAQSSGTPSAFSPAGTYALRVAVDRDTVRFGITVVDSAGRWTGQFISASGRRRPLVAVVPQPDSGRVVVQYTDGAGFATMLLNLRGDAVQGAAEYPDGTFAIVGTRSRAVAAAGAR